MSLFFPLNTNPLKIKMNKLFVFQTGAFFFRAKVTLLLCRSTGMIPGQPANVFPSDSGYLHVQQSIDQCVTEFSLLVKIFMAYF